jgi:hypothetical protein
MTDQSQAALRAELQEAIAKVRHQIEIQSISDHYVGGGRSSADAIEELRAELVQLEDARGNLG